MEKRRIHRLERLKNMVVNSKAMVKGQEIKQLGSRHDSRDQEPATLTLALMVQTHM